jgi:hypothetical protein
MGRQKTECGALSVGQLARRWGLGVSRVRDLVENGLLPGAFRIPSAGKFGEAVRIPLGTIQRAEEEWGIGEQHGAQQRRLPPRSGGGSVAALRHFPELRPEHDAGCPEDARH